MGKGLTLAYEPPHQRDGKIVVKLTTENIKATDSYWSTSLIGYVLDSITTVPLLVNFLGLPVGFWSAEALSKVASAIGKMLYTDKYTADMNLNCRYDWRPNFCNDCFRFGHNTEEYWMNHKGEREENNKD
ncbi:hypothetical protein KY285_023638 [Solanum tuberosum]|nr:hypothetical protein KY289_026077 [Solanum tuberosum]KAH0675837.1 hypothetical protein KY285_023638 [Solanum tuberosum]